MKIYNKKKFAFGVFSLALSVLNLVINILRHDVDASALILVVALSAIGIDAIIRSLSRKMTREEKLEALDERNQLIAWKSKSQAFQLTQAISFFLMLALLVMGKVSGYKGLVAMGIGLSFVFSISMFTELFTFLYYESRN